MPKLTKIYTRKGDTGMTALAGGQQVPKNRCELKLMEQWMS